MAVGDLIKPVIHDYLLATAEDREPDGMWHPSSLFQCDRQAVYQVRATPETDFKTGEDMIPLAMGKAIHTLIQSAVTYSEFEAAVGSRQTPIQKAWHEVKVLIPGLKVTGSADSLVLLDDGTYEVEEFKSTKSSGIMWADRAAKKNGGVGFQPKPNHVSQGLAYVYAMRYFPYRVVNDDPDDMSCPNCQSPWECNGPHEPETHIEMPPLGNKLSKLRVTYFGKDAGEILEFTYEITPEWEEQFVKYIWGLEKHRPDDAPLPPRLARGDDGKKSWLCNWCAFRTRCWETDGDGEEL